MAASRRDRGRRARRTAGIEHLAARVGVTGRHRVRHSSAACVSAFLPVEVCADAASVAGERLLTDSPFLSPRLRWRAGFAVCAVSMRCFALSDGAGAMRRDAAPDALQAGHAALCAPVPAALCADALAGIPAQPRHRRASRRRRRAHADRRTLADQAPRCDPDIGRIDVQRAPRRKMRRAVTIPASRLRPRRAAGSWRWRRAAAARPALVDPAEISCATGTLAVATPGCACPWYLRWLPNPRCARSSASRSACAARRTDSRVRAGGGHSGTTAVRRRRGSRHRARCSPRRHHRARRAGPGVARIGLTGARAATAQGARRVAVAWVASSCVPAWTARSRRRSRCAHCR